jgi:hypothetical protein
MRACIEVVRNQIAASDLRFDPAALAEAVEPKYASWMLLAASAFKIKAGESGEAKALFERALKTGEPSDLLFARVAILLGEPTLVVRSLRLSLKRALAIDDADRRALHLASLAALARAVLPR